MTGNEVADPAMAYECRRLRSGTPVVSREDAEPGVIMDICTFRRNGADAWSYLVDTRYGSEVWEAGELFVPSDLR